MNPASQPSATQRHFHLVNRLINGQDWPRLLEAAREWLAEDPESVVAHRSAAQALVNLNRHAEALPHLDRALSLQPNHGFTHRLVSVTAFHLKDYSRADAAIQRGLELQPNDAMHWHHLAFMRYQQGALDVAAKHATRSQELDPDNPANINLLALCERNNVFKQFQQYRRALALDPENSMVHNNLGVHYLNVDQDYVLAERSFRQALRLNPTDKTAQQNLLLVLRHRDRLYRVLQFPLNLGRGYLAGITGPGHSIARRIRAATVLLFMLIFGNVFAGLLILSILVSFPIVKVYEYLTLGDIRAEAGKPGARRGGLFGYRGWPLAIRFGLFLSLTAVFLGGIGLALRQAPELGFQVFIGLSMVAGVGCAAYLLHRLWLGLRLRRLVRKGEKTLAKSSGVAER